jgi:hypothetical protein
MNARLQRNGLPGVLANRSFNDLSQYPVFPWVIREFNTPTLDLTDPAVFRDLALPIGAISEQRLHIDKQTMSRITDETEVCLSRSHYSTAAAVINFQLRIEPFTSLHILFHSGQFGHDDRLFSSLAQTWAAVTERQGDSRELIPEFYSTTELFENVNGLDLRDCQLPKWANIWHEFVEKHRQALESEYVRSKIHSWIDLIFGCSQRSIEKNNLFHRFTYRDCIDHVKDKKMRHTIKHFCANFGTCPIKLFTSPHKRSSAYQIPHLISDFIFERGIQAITFFSSDICLDENGDIFRVLPGGSHDFPAVRYKRGEFLSLLFLKSCNQFLALHPTGVFASVGPTRIIAHKALEIQCIALVDAETVVTGGSDCLICVWSVPNCELIGTIPMNSSTIVSIDASAVLNIVVLANVSHQVFVNWCCDRKNFLSWQVTCEVNAEHRIVFLTNGCIVLTCEVEGNFQLLFFNLQGKELVALRMKGRLVKLIPIRTKLAETFLIVTKATKRVKALMVQISRF